MPEKWPAGIVALIVENEGLYTDRELAAMINDHFSGAEVSGRQVKNYRYRHHIGGKPKQDIPEEIGRYIQENIDGHTVPELTMLVNQTIEGASVSCSEVKNYIRRKKLKSGLRRTFPVEVCECIQGNYAGRSNKELADFINSRFGTGTITEAQLRAYKGKRRLKAGTGEKITKEMDTFIKLNAKGRSVGELALLVNAWFGPETTDEVKLRRHMLYKEINPGRRHEQSKEVRKFMEENSDKYDQSTLLELVNSKYGDGAALKILRAWPAELQEFVKTHADGLKSEEIADLVNCKFGKGTVTAKQISCYKKNHDIVSGTNTLPIGAMRTANGNPIMKTDSGEWKRLEKIVWEQHNGPAPKHAMIIHIDGDLNNCDIDNLALATESEKCVVCKRAVGGSSRKSKATYTQLLLHRLQGRVLALKKGDKSK